MDGAWEGEAELETCAVMGSAGRELGRADPVRGETAAGPELVLVLLSRKLSKTSREEWKLSRGEAVPCAPSALAVLRQEKPSLAVGELLALGELLVAAEPAEAGESDLNSDFRGVFVRAVVLALARLGEDTGAGERDDNSDDGVFELTIGGGESTG